MSWFAKLLPSKIRVSNSQSSSSVPEGIWQKCDGCGAVLYQPELERNAKVCPKCDHHFRINARTRLDLLLDNEGQIEIAPELEAIDKLKFKDTKKYKDRIVQAKKKTGENEALIAIQGRLATIPVVAVAFEFNFIGGSMGGVVGEKFVRAINTAIEYRTPFICFSTSGGARMQEALGSLLQMAKTSAALRRYAELGLPYISVLVDPTMGGVSASLAMLGDIIIAEPKALVGFAGPRVIQQTVRETLPEGFQRSEALLKHGAIDMIVDRRELREVLASLLAKFLRQSPPVLNVETTLDEDAFELDE